MNIELNTEFKELEPRLYQQIFNTLVQYQVNNLLNHLEYDDYDYKKNVLGLTDTQIKVYECLPFEYIRDNMAKFLSASYEIDEHIEYLNDNLTFFTPIENLEIDYDVEQEIDRETLYDIKEQLGLVD